MAESIEVVRQMMAEAKLFEAQLEAERLLSLDPSLKKDLLPLYQELLREQNKIVPDALKLEVSEIVFHSDLNKAESLLKEIQGVFLVKNFSRIQELKIHIAEKKGHIEDLYKLISDYQIFLYESQIPSSPTTIQTFVEKYFKDDYGLKLQKLSLEMLRNDFSESEKSIQELVFSCVEKASPKGNKEKIRSLYEVLKVQKERGHLEVYLNFCFLFLEGISDKKDYKKLLELVVYFDDAKFQAQILMLFHKLGLGEITQDYAEVVKSHQDYSYVYFDKFFPDLKKYLFVAKKLNNSSEKVGKVEIDLTLEPYKEEIIKNPHSIVDISPESETRFINIIKHEDYSVEDLTEIAVSFLESEFPRAAIHASEQAISKCQNGSSTFLKASYLKLSALIMIRDYRAALDTTLKALEYATNKGDILSFLYSQAEIYLQLGQKNQARTIYKKILTVDGQYRLAKEKLEKLNEV